MSGDPETFTYFAYGSNMLSDRLRFRTPSCRVLGVATLAGHTLRFHKGGADGSGKCDAFATGLPGDVVIGVLYAIDKTDKPALDRAEGVHHGYEDAAVTVTLADGTSRAAVAYLATDDAIDDSTTPYVWYKDFVVDGAREHDLPRAYVEHFIASVAAVPDPDPAHDRARRAERRRASE